MNKKSLFWIFVFVLLVSNSLAIDSTINKYYSSFAKEDFNSYWSTLYLEDYSQSELELRKDGILETWKVIDTLSYEIKDLIIEENGDLGVASYVIKTTLGEITDNGPNTLSYEMDMTAILINSDGWRVYSVNPSKLLRENIDEIYKEEDIVLPNSMPEIKETKKSDQKFKSDCGDGICSSNEVCPFDCETVLETNLPPLGLKVGECSLDYSKVKELEGKAIPNIPLVDSLIGNNKVLLIKIDDKEFSYLLKDKKLSKSDNEPDLIIDSDSCTIARIIGGSDPKFEYEQGNINLRANGFVDKVKLGFSNLLFTIYSWFTSQKEFLFEAEEGILVKGGRYSSIGPSGRGPGEVYLGNGNAQVNYDFEVDEGEYHFYISITDDKKHSNGARDATFNINGKDIKYSHVSKNTMTKNSVWTWEYLGKVTLQNTNKMTLIKDKSTSAAFIMDKFKFSVEKIE